MFRLPRPARSALVLPVLAVAVACDSPTGNEGARLILISGPALSDTIMAMPAQHVIVELRDERGVPLPNAHVTFTGRKAQSADSLIGLRGVFACPPGLTECYGWSATWGWSGIGEWTALTDAQGRAAVKVQFGQVAGLTAIDVKHDESEVRMTIPVTTRAGARAGAYTPVRDTVVYVGSSYSLAAVAADRLDNPVSGTVTVTALDPAVATYSGGTITAVATGRARFTMAAGVATDTAFVSVPPAARLVAMGPPAIAGGMGRLMLVNLDGSGRKPLVATYGSTGNVIPTWTPTGDRIVYQEEDASGGNVALKVIDTLGNAPIAFPVTPGVTFAMQPVFSHTEGRLYLFGNSIAGSGVYRVEQNGAGAVYVHPAVQPGPSPDGTRLAFVIGDSVKTRDLGTGVETFIDTNGLLPRWSPAGNEVAYVNQSSGALMLVHPDGTGSRRIGGTMTYGGVVTFSPDGTWVLATNASGHFDLIRVSDGVRLPLVTMRGFSQAAWR